MGIRLVLTGSCNREAYRKTNRRHQRLFLVIWETSMSTTIGLTERKVDVGIPFDI